MINFHSDRIHIYIIVLIAFVFCFGLKQIYLACFVFYLLMQVEIQLLTSPCLTYVSKPPLARCIVPLASPVGRTRQRNTFLLAKPAAY